MRVGMIAKMRVWVEDGKLLWGLAAVFALVEIHSGLSASHIDTPQIWTGLHHFLRGLSPYGVVTHQPFGYDHPPGSTVVDTPLGLLSLSLAGDLIVIVSGLGCLAAILVLTRRWDELEPWRPALAALIVAISRPFHEELSLGNLDLLSMLVIALGLLAIGRRKERVGAVLMALGVCIKPTAVLVLLAPLLAKRWRTTALAVTVFGFLMLVGFAVVPHSWRFFTSVVPYLTGPEQGKADYNGSLTGVVEYLGLSGSIPAGVTQAVALLVFVAIALRYRKVLVESLYGSVALLVVATLLVPRYSFEVYGLYLVLAFPFILQAQGRLEIALAAIAVWFLAIRDVLPLHGAAVDHFRQLRPGLGHIALAVLVVVLLERRRAGSGAISSRPLRHEADSAPLAAGY